MQCVRRLHPTNSRQRRDNRAEWHGVHIVLPATHTFIHESNEPSCRRLNVVRLKRSVMACCGKSVYCRCGLRKGAISEYHYA